MPEPSLRDAVDILTQAVASANFIPSIEDESKQLFRTLSLVAMR
jgi:hypothetical protein